MTAQQRDSNKTKAYKDLRYRIITQQLPPGELLKDKDLMARYHIGRTPLREILIELQRQGLIRRVPRSGTWVAPLDLDFVRQIAEIRLPLERLAGELAAERISDAQIAALEKLLQEAESAQPDKDDDLQVLIQHESSFHHIVYTATGNQKLKELLIEYQSISSRLWHNLFFTHKHLKRMFQDQRGMLEALKAHDGKLSGERMASHTQAYFGRINGI